MKNLKIGSFIFNDGIRQQEVFDKYDNWFTSLEYDDYSKAYVVIDDEKIDLFNNSKELKVGNDFELEDIKEISKNYNLEILDNNIGVRCVTKTHFFDRFFITENKKYLIIYSLGGTKSFESIFIYGIWKIAH